MADAWVLEVNGRPLAAARSATSRVERTRGLLGTVAGGVLVLPNTRSVHSFAMGYALDVALCGADGEVLATLCLEPNRITRPRRRVRTVVEAPAGTFDRWGVHVGDSISLRPRR